MSVLSGPSQDTLLESRAWGFALASVHTPVLLWHGEEVSRLFGVLFPFDDGAGDVVGCLSIIHHSKSDTSSLSVCLSV